MTTPSAPPSASSNSPHRKSISYFGIADGVKADFVRFRQCDARLNAQGGRKTASAYDAIGAAQVAKASFSGMRLLHRLDDKVRDLADGSNACRQWKRGRRNLYARIYLRRAGMTGTKLRSGGRAQPGARRTRQSARAAALRAQRPPDRCAGHGRRVAGALAMNGADAPISRLKGSPRISRKAKAGPSACFDPNAPLGAGLAQLVEQRFCKPKVAGSNPASGTIGAVVQPCRTT